MNGEIKDVLIEFDPDGSLATTHESQGSDMGLFGGLLGWDATDERLATSATWIQEAGIQVASAKTERRPDKIDVVAFDDVWVRNPAAYEDPKAPERLFAGEQAVSSALLGLVPAIVYLFVATALTDWSGAEADVSPGVADGSVLVSAGRPLPLALCRILGATGYLPDLQQ